MKDNGFSEKANAVLSMFVLEPYYKYFGPDKATPYKPAFKPFLSVVCYNSIYGGKDGKSLDESYFDWALDVSKLQISPRVDIALIQRSQMILRRGSH